MTTSTRERRDWTLLVFIIPIGIFLMLIAGQIAVRLVPIWSINAGMQSKLDPNNLSQQQNGIVQPILPAILTPLGWFDTFLTPGADAGNQNVVFPPFVVFEPSATPAVTSPPPTVATTQPPPTISTVVSPTVVVPPPVTSTYKPPVDPPTSVPPIATATASTTATATATATVTSTASTTATATATATSTATATGYPSTPFGTQDVSTPAGFNIGTPDGTISGVPNGHFVVIDLGANPIKVNGPSDTNYDMVYYEMNNPTCPGVCMDQVIVGISQLLNGSPYYVVLNWGDGIPDTNTNVGVITSSTGTENDNQQIPLTSLYGTTPYQTGILIDVDNALSAPPVGLYQFIVIQVPFVGTDPGADIDSIQILPDPKLATAAKESISPAQETSIPPTDQIPILPADSAPSPPVDTVSNSSADTAPVPPVDTTPNQPADTTPNQPADTTPNQPADTTSTTSDTTDTTPVPPVDTAPNQPADNASPAADASSNPSADTTSTTSADATPNQPADTTSTTSADTAPSSSVDNASPAADTAPNPPADQAAIPAATP